MCGIAGMIDLAGRRPVPEEVVGRMSAALFHRGPDEEGFLFRPGVGLANRRLSIVGLADGRQPIGNEDGTVQTVFNGELFDYPEERDRLTAAGHTFRTHTDTELIPHLWEDHGEEMMPRLLGQFAIAVWDQKRQTVFLARDRFGICPLYWSRQGDWLLFASEVRALFASGLVPPRPDVRGIDQVFHFFAVPGPHSCFAGVNILLPSHCLSVPVGGNPATLTPRPYWQIEFPDRGEEVRATDERKLADEFEAELTAAVNRRLRADVPVVAYLSGGVDSSIVTALAVRALGRPLPTFTIRVPHKGLDETHQAAETARRLGCSQQVVECGDAEVTADYPRLVRAAEAPVVDTSCVGLLRQADAVHRAGYKVALTGEGSDEWLAGYSWFKVHRMLAALDSVPGLPVGRWARRLFFRFLGGGDAVRHQADLDAAAGGPHAFGQVYALMALSRHLFSPEVRAELAGHNPFADLAPDLGRVKRWHPMHRALYWGGRIHLAGHLLCLKGDRVAMHSSVETRYPFLDERVFAFLARLHPDWKLRRMTEKYLLRRVAERLLPADVAWRRKGMFRAPFDSFFYRGAPPFVGQLLSEASLRKTGYFDPEAVRRNLERLPGRRGYGRTAAEMGLVAVVATQLWHHTFFGGGLADLPAA